MDEYLKSLGDIPDNLSDLLAGFKDVKNDYEIKVEKINTFFKITLMERLGVAQGNRKKCIVIKLYEEPLTYSIRMYKTLSDNQYEKIYEIKVEGTNNSQRIKQDIDDLLSGKKGKPHRHSIPF